ncbi:MAG: threonyl-tRNA synthetase editing domain-containing protein [Zestosphaera sp.]
MRTLIIHAEEFSTRITEKALREAEEPPELNALALKNALVAFMSVEEGDESAVDELVVRFTNDLKSLAASLRPSAVVLYPYAHLSKNLAKPGEALRVLKALEARTREVLEGIPVYRTPFGWYKQFTIACYGHPLSELSREYRPEELSGATIPAARCFILDKEGNLHMVDSGQTYVSGLDLMFFRHACITKEVSREWRMEERVRELLSKFSFRLIKDGAKTLMYRVGPGVDVDDTLIGLSRSIVTELAREYNIRGARVIIDNYIATTCESDCINAKHAALADELGMTGGPLPYYIYEVATVHKTFKADDFRSSLSVLRKPHLTIFARDKEEGIKLVTRLVEHLLGRLESLELRDSLVPVMVMTIKSFEEGVWRPISKLLSNSFDEVVLIVRECDEDELRCGLAVELHYVDSGGVPTLVSRTSMGSRTNNALEPSKQMLIISSELLGPSEVLIYALVDRAHKLEASGKTPYLPPLIMPVQVRIIPVDSNTVAYANSVAEMLANAGVRVEVDSRELGLGRKVREAGVEWIPYIVVVGEREKETNTVNVRVRHLGIQKSLSIEEFVNLLKHQQIPTS